MKNTILKFFIFILILFMPVFPETVFVPGASLNAGLYAETADAYLNYIELKKRYLEWKEGVFKSKTSAKKAVKNFLISIYTREIKTDYNYILLCPECITDKQLVCKLYLEKWLEIRGEISPAVVEDLVKSRPELVKSWWRTDVLVSVTGTVRDFFIEEYQSGKKIILLLSDIRLEANEHSYGNNRKQEKPAEEGKGDIPAQ